jgi:hypothetical protein
LIRGIERRRGSGRLKRAQSAIEPQVPEMKEIENAKRIREPHTMFNILRFNPQEPGSVPRM